MSMFPDPMVFSFSQVSKRLNCCGVATAADNGGAAGGKLGGGGTIMASFRKAAP